MATLMPPDLARALLSLYAARKGKLDRAAAASVLGAYLRTRGAPDRHGNFVNDRERWHFSAQNLQHQERYDGAWRNISSRPVAEAALLVLAEAAKVAEDGAAQARVAAEQRGRTGAADRRTAKAEGDERHDLAARAAFKAIGFESPDESLRGMGYGRPLTPKMMESLKARLGALRDGFLASAEAGAALPGDGSFASIDRPPVVAMARRLQFRWTESLGDFRYTVTVEHQTDGTANVEIGRAGSVAVNASAMTASFARGGREGDGYLSGSISIDKTGRRSASLFMLVSRSPLAGFRVASLWCRMMAGLGVAEWSGVGLNEKAQRFVELLGSRGAVEVVGRQGSSLLLRCARRAPNPPRDAFVLEAQVSPPGTAIDEPVGMIEIDGCPDVDPEDLPPGDCGAEASFGTARDLARIVGDLPRRHFAALAREIERRSAPDDVVALLDHFRVPPKQRAPGRSDALWRALEGALKSEGVRAVYTLLGPDPDTDPRLLRSFMQMRGFEEVGTAGTYPILRLEMADRTKPRSVFIDLRPTPAQARALARSGTVIAEDLHLTLGFLDRADRLGPDGVERALRAVQRAAARHGRIRATVTGARRFPGADRQVVYGSVRSPGVEELRRDVVAELAREGLTPDGSHDFVPHVTLGKAAKGAPWPYPDPRGRELTFDAVRLWVGREAQRVPLAGGGRKR